jgi:hypothetical protein
MQVHGDGLTIAIRFYPWKSIRPGRPEGRSLHHDIHPQYGRAVHAAVERKFPAECMTNQRQVKKSLRDATRDRFPRFRSKRGKTWETET